MVVKTLPSGMPDQDMFPVLSVKLTVCTVKFYGLIGSLILTEKVRENSDIKINKMILNPLTTEELDESFKKPGLIKLLTSHFS